MKHERLPREQLYMGIAQLMALRSTCPRASVGAVAVQDGRVVATGYNGAPAKEPHCLDVGCDIQRVGYDEQHSDEECHCIRTVHAEANLIAWAARAGVALFGASMYTTHGLCLNCAKLAVNAGFSTINYTIIYDRRGIDLLYKAGLQVFCVPYCDLVQYQDQ